MAEGFSLESISEAISLAANSLLLRNGKERAHGDSTGVHASDSAIAWRNIALVSNPRNRVASLIVAGFHTAGQSGYDLVREFTQELPQTTASNAWQRAVQLVTTGQLDLTREPRVRATADETLTAEHPFFWAGYLLVDTGAEPPKE